LTIHGESRYGDGINAKDGTSHHITIENNIILNFDANQQTVGISTKTPAWDWIIRNNRIINAGTGIYLGNSNGGSPFIGGLIEGNYIVNPIGYCMQIKHQNSRPNIAGIPTADRRTIIRNNVFIKDDRPTPQGNRPNFLLDGFPDTGNGSNDTYEVYGNFFYNNPRESLAQISGRVIFHDNILVQPSTSQVGLYLTNHNRPLKLAYVYNNTVYGGSSGIRFGATPSEDSIVLGNLILSNGGIAKSERAKRVEDNIIDSMSNASLYVKTPSTQLNSMDFYPLSNTTKGTPLNLDQFSEHMDFNVDFNGNDKSTREYRGAYSGEGTNPGWQLQSDNKQGGASSNRENPPNTPVGLEIMVN